ncbi:putative transcription factor TGA like domain-containing protein [Helianthus debilis subsp. tardiflorus]
MTKPENTQRQNFHRFFNCWLDELNSNLQQLVLAANHHEDDGDGDGEDLRMLINNSIGRYEKYYKVKSEAAKEDVISMFSPKWLTSLEDAFLWIAGWRPTTAIHLLYSKSGIQFEASPADLSIFKAGDLGHLNSNQISRVDKLHQKTIRAERNICDRMATLQESAADTSMVDLSNVISEMMRKENDDGGDDNDRRVELALEPKKDEWEKVLNMADSLRMETLKSVIEILTPIQAVYFLIAAAELHLRLHDWGLKKDAEYIN